MPENLVRHTNVPPTRHDSADAREAFASILLKLFDEYPTDDPDYRRFRKHVIWALGQSSDGTAFANSRAREAAFMACDTGVPNGEILAAYAMLFT